MAFLTGYGSIAQRAASNVIPGIAWSHPLAKGLIAAYYPGSFPGGTMINLASPGNGDIITQGGTATPLVATPEGPGINIAGNGTTTRYVNGPCPPALLNGKVSMFVRAQWKPGQATGGQVCRIFGIWFDNPQVSPYYVYAISVDNNSTAQNLGLVFAASSSVFLSSLVVPNPPPLVVGSMVSGGGVWYGTPSVPAAPSEFMYQNGSVAFLSTSEHAGFYGAAPQIGFGDSNSTRNAACIPTVAYAWNRTLGAAEMRYLDANPYSLLQWKIDLVYEILEQPVAIPPSGIGTSSMIPLAPLMMGGAALEWLGRRKITMRRLRGK